LPSIAGRAWGGADMDGGRKKAFVVKGRFALNINSSTKNNTNWLAWAPLENARER